MNSVKLSVKSFEELKALREAIENNPANRMPASSGSWYLYIPKAREKLANIAWAITYKLAEGENQVD